MSLNAGFFSKSIYDKQAYDDKVLFKEFSMQIQAGERVAIIGPNGIGKTTLLQCMVGDVHPDSGTAKWAETADVGYFAQDHTNDFANDATLFEWMGQWTKGDDQLLRGTLGRMLFSGDEIDKSVKEVII